MDTIEQPDVRRAFVNSSRSRAAAVTFPRPWPPAEVEQRDFLAWTDPKAPLRAYLVVPPPLVAETVAIELRLGEQGGPPRASLCDWCHTQDAEGGCRLVVAPRAGSRGRAGNSVGVYVCADFDCSLRARRPLKAHQRSVSGAPDLRVEELGERVGQFVARVLDEA
ncbi:FBP domain-containing protein [Aeromicrobium sp. Leaf350]|uniref:FBP domain-containing protein n=1 Tax=Aeromicrobium sp. Leaf350 TaxID=2876565 RepID=UPI001E43D14A|nr:FBP domain-containing protein [Aeromicrobium sp. Leaf350]